mmetsp:Transcript_29302/g.59943  ORF Transcript_29302/g.59943 Transcript_29302/m.59943 type:complete len:107 (-) Transcript_29302:43-363(-)
MEPVTLTPPPTASRPASNESSVVLPPPEGPSKPTTVPRLQTPLARSRIVTVDLVFLSLNVAVRSLTTKATSSGWTCGGVALRGPERRVATMIQKEESGAGPQDHVR